MKYLYFRAYYYDGLSEYTVICPDQKLGEEVIKILESDYGEFVAIVDRIVGEKVDFGEWIQAKLKELMKRHKSITKKVKRYEKNKKKIMEKIEKHNKEVENWTPPSFNGNVTVFVLRPRLRNYEEESKVQKKEKSELKKYLEILDSLIES